MTPSLDVYSPSYIPRDPSQTVLYTAVADHLETFLASLDTDPDARGLPPMWNANCTPTCSAASSRTALCGWAVTPATTSCCSPSAASGAGFVRGVAGGAGPRPRRAWAG